jgi:hypothetical protein
MHLLFFPRRCAIMARFGAMAIGGAGVGAILPTAGLNPKLQHHKPSHTCKRLSPEVDMVHCTLCDSFYLLFVFLNTQHAEF